MAKELQDSSEVVVEEVRRFTLKDLVDDFNSSAISAQSNLRLVWRNGGISMRIGASETPASVDEIYTVGGSAWALFRCAGKRFKVAIGNDGISIFDSSRRRVVAVFLKNQKLVLQRAFQHPPSSVSG